MTEEDSEQRCRNEREARSLALEKAYVHDVYNQIAPHFAHSSSKAWPRVKQFLYELEPGSLVCDTGCGNGKYLDVNQEIFKVGSDRCHQLTEIARKRNHELAVCDSMHLPFRDESFDAALSIAVIHHFATTERRVQALRELTRILRLGGRLMITVWAMEQRHRRFESQDVLVPWHKPVESSSEEQPSQADGDITSTTTSDDDILNYHAHSQFDSDSNYTPCRYSKRRHRARTNQSRCQGRMFETMCQSSSQSSSDLSSPNETCYSFVRRALAKFSSSTSWDDQRKRCRPSWFTQNTVESEHSTLEQQESVESNENAEDLPIELHDVDTQMAEPDVNQAVNSRHKQPILPALNNSLCSNSSQLNRKSKSKSLSDILSLFPVSFLRPRKASHDSNIDYKTKETSDINLGIMRSKSSHTHLTKVEEGEDSDASPLNMESTKQFFPSLMTSTPCSKKIHMQETRRPRSLIIQGERMLNADDHRNGNTILPDLDYEIENGLLVENSYNSHCSKRSSWPVSCQKAVIFSKHTMPDVSILNDDVSYKSDYQSGNLNGDSLPDSGIEDLHDKNSGTWNRFSLKNLSVLDPKQCDLPTRLRKLFMKQCQTTFSSNMDNVMKDILYQNLINHAIEQEHLFPCHSMPDLNVHNLQGLSLDDMYEFQKDFEEELNLDTEWNKENATWLIRNGYKQRSISADVTSALTRRKYINLVNHSVINKYVKRSISMENPASDGFLDFVESNRVYCNRITKEDSLQHDTSFDSDDSVASVIAVTQNKFSSEELCQDSKSDSPDISQVSVTKEGSMHSDTSLDSEDSCISVIAMPLKDNAAIEPLEVLQKDTTQNIDLCPTSDLDIVHQSTEDCNSQFSSLNRQMENHTHMNSFPTNLIKEQIPAMENNLISLNPNALIHSSESCNNKNSYSAHKEYSNDNISENKEQTLQQLHKGGSLLNLTQESTTLYSDPEPTNSEFSSNNSLLDKKILRKAGSLPEQYEPQLSNLSNLSNQSGLSVSTDFSLSSRFRLDECGSHSMSGSLSSSRSSSSSSICWEKFLDASHSVVLDNIAVVTAGSDILQSRRSSTAFLKNASQHSHLLHNVTKHQNPLLTTKDTDVPNLCAGKVNKSKCFQERTLHSDNRTENSEMVTSCSSSNSSSLINMNNFPLDTDVEVSHGEQGTTDCNSITENLDSSTTNINESENNLKYANTDQVNENFKSDRNDGDLFIQSDDKEISVDLEFKEAGVQTSLILYSGIGNDSVDESNLCKPLCSAAQEDELNGNVPTIYLPHSSTTESTFKSIPSPVDVAQEHLGSKTDHYKNMNCSPQFVKILNVQSVQPTGSENSGNTMEDVSLSEKDDSTLQTVKTVNCYSNCKLLCPTENWTPKSEASNVNVPVNQTFKDTSSDDNFVLSEKTENENETHDSYLKPSATDEAMLTSTSSSIEKHFGNLEFITDEDHLNCSPSPSKNIEDGNDQSLNPDSKCLNRERSLSLSTSDDSLQCESEMGGSVTFHRYYHVFREGELDQLIEKYVENLHIISSYYDHANWCIIAEKVQVWRI